MRMLHGLWGLGLVFLCHLHPAQFACGFVLLRSSPLLSSRPPLLLCDSPTTRLQGLSAQQSPIDATDCSEKPTNQDLDPWFTARKNLRDPECCVVSVCSARNFNENHKTTTGTEHRNNPLDAHLAVLQERLATKGPSDIDIRARIDTTTFHLALNDCLGVCSSMIEAGGNLGGKKDETTTTEDGLVLPATALADLAMGMASFADDCKGIHSRGGVFLRIVCASSYRAHDPVFHTDKAPLRGYATLRGVGTEFVSRPCSPLEYVALRILGTTTGFPLFGSNTKGDKIRDVRCASEKEFIVMKGDYYYRGNSAATPSSSSSWWQRAFACVHRSPPGTARGSKRVILSFDLADGDDDREWHDAHQKRRWRAGMTQRKSKLVA